MNDPTTAPDASSGGQRAELVARYRLCPPIVRAAIDALLTFEESVDEMGYDISYYQADLPAAVAVAIKPWEGM